MNKLILICFIGLTNYINAQWTYKTVKSEFDGSYKVAYTEIVNNAFLKMEQGSDIVYLNDTFEVLVPYFYLKSTFFCSDSVWVDFAFYVDTMVLNFTAKASINNQNNCIFFDNDIWSKEFIGAFVGCNKVSVRVDDDHCGKTIYRFNMKNSKKAFLFIITP